MSAAGARARRLVRRALPPLVASSHTLPEGGPVALTFDDGPDRVFTPALLDLLAEHGVRATFFVIGERARRHPHLVRRALDEGHAVGSHTWSHPEPSAVSPAAMAQEVVRGHLAVTRAAGRRVPLFRPPMGHVGHGLSAGVRLARLDSWLWSVDPRDWRPGVHADDLTAELGRVAGGDVVLLHDGIALATGSAAHDRSATVRAVQRLLRAAPARGLTFAPLPLRSG